MQTAALSLSAMLPLEAVGCDVHANTWRDAVRAAGDLLLRSGAAHPDYTQAMLETVERFGPYIVIAPGLALAHAQASDAVRRPGLSLARLRSPVAFGHASNDPVDLVVGLCSPDHETHVGALQQLATLLADPAVRERLRLAPTPAALRTVLLTPTP